MTHVFYILIAFFIFVELIVLFSQKNIHSAVKRLKKLNRFSCRVDVFTMGFICFDHSSCIYPETLALVALC